MKVDTKKEINKEQKSVTTTISFDQLLPKNLLEVLEKNGIIDLINETTICIDNAHIKKGVMYATISSTIYP